MLPQHSCRAKPAALVRLATAVLTSVSRVRLRQYFLTESDAASKHAIELRYSSKAQTREQNSTADTGPREAAIVGTAHFRLFQN